MKKFFLLFIPAVLAVNMALAGCSSEEEDRESELKSSLESTYEELTSTFSGETGQYGLVSEYLKSWANKNDMTIVKEHENYMVMMNPATEGAENAETTVLQCPIETDDFSNSLQVLAISLTTLLGPENHGSITLIVTECSDGEFLGAAAIDPEYFQGDHFINMQHHDDVQLFTSGSYEQTASMTSNLTMAKPSYSQAYAITMSTSGFHDPFHFNGHYPNPIEVVGNLLATGKSSGQLFELASFECEVSPGYTPSSATAIVVIDSNDVESFTKKFNSSYNNMKDRFEKLEDNFVYTFTETAMPAQVISSQSSDNIISLMYTLKTGVYQQDEDSGTIIAASDISHVSTLDKKFQLKMTFRSTDKVVLAEMSNVFLTTSGLCDIGYSPSETRMTWTSDSEKSLAAFFADALGTESSVFSNTLESSESNLLSAKADLNAVSYRFDIHHGEAATANVLHFLESLTQPSEDAESEDTETEE